MADEQKYLVGSDGALYCRVRPPPVRLLDVETGRVEDVEKVGGMMPWPYVQQMKSTIPIGLCPPYVHSSSMMNMAAENPFSPIGGGQGFQPVGPGMMQPPLPPGMHAVMPEMCGSRAPSLVSMASESQSPFLNAAHGVVGIEDLDARRRSLLTRVDELSNTLSELRNAESVRLMPLQGGQTPVQGTLPMSDLRAYYGIPNLPHHMSLAHGQVLKTLPQVLSNEQDLKAPACTSLPTDRVYNQFAEPNAKRRKVLSGSPVQDENLPGTLGALSTFEISPGSQTFQPVTQGIQATSHKRTPSLVESFHPLAHEFNGACHRRTVSAVEPMTRETLQASHARKVSVIGRSFPLYIKCDDLNLSLFQCFARKQMEIFEATEEDAGRTAQGRNKAIVAGQIGLRCIHCVNLPHQKKKAGAIYYPSRLDGIYQTAQKMISGHLLQKCQMIPTETREKLKFYKAQTKSNDGGGKAYWKEGVECYGVYETETNGLAFKPNAAAPVDR